MSIHILLNVAYISTLLSDANRTCIQPTQNGKYKRALNPKQTLMTILGTILFCVYWHKYYSLNVICDRPGVPLDKSNDIHDKIIDGNIKQILTSLNDITAINRTMKTFWCVESYLKCWNISNTVFINLVSRSILHTACESNSSVEVTENMPTWVPYYNDIYKKPKKLKIPK